MYLIIDNQNSEKEFGGYTKKASGRNTACAHQPKSKSRLKG